MKIIRELAFSIAFLPFAASAQEAVEYPTGYRDWHHVKTMLIHPGHSLYASFGGIHHIYANPKAMEGYRSGQFPAGAIIAFDLLESVDRNNATTEGNRKVLGVMHKDSRRFAATGGWGFEGFAGGDPAKRAVGADAEAACYQCHTQRADQDYVFSSLRH